MKIGIDFGSTYSTFSRFDDSRQLPEALTHTEGESASIPSVVSISRKGDVSCGSGAKKHAGKNHVRIFEAFKMLLTEHDPRLLASCGYDAQYTPRAVARMYLESTLGGLMKRYHCDTLEEIVVCVPEIWFNSPRTQDGRVILRDVLEREVRIPDVKLGHVRMVSEPEAASAYFAFHYERESGRPFNGHLLLIDYGGGTLDLTLTHVRSDGRGSVIIAALESGGAGENHPATDGTRSIGSAGIAYMQCVVVMALRCAGLLGREEAPDYKSPGFMSMVKDLEGELKSPEGMVKIEDFFGEYGSYSRLERMLRDEPEEFYELDCGGEPVSVTYHHLLLAYRQIIAPVLEEQIGRINEKVRGCIGRDPCARAAGEKDDFKLALVGGFGSFYLVKSHLAELYHLDKNTASDPRVRSIDTHRRELAISLGAALLAAGRVRLKRIARYSIGLRVEDPDDVKRNYYAIRYHQALKPNHVYLILTAASTPMVFGSLAGRIKQFAVCYSDRDEDYMPMTLMPEMLRRLDALSVHGLWNVGFSIDENDIITFHVRPSRHYADARPEDARDIPLADYANMFKLSGREEEG